MKNRRVEKSSLIAEAIRHNYLALAEDKININLSGKYGYLESAYYFSQDLENRQETVRPTCKEILDAYIVPVSLEKAKLAGIGIPNYYLTNGYFEPPVIIDPINPFMWRSSIILKSSRKAQIAKSLTRNYTYAICCQELPPLSKVVTFHAVMGWSVSERYRKIAEAIWKIFSIPVATVRIIITDDDGIIFSSISDLAFESLNMRELAYLQERITWAE